jgi:hypothetical protein
MTKARDTKPGDVVARGNGGTAVILHVNYTRAHILAEEGEERVELPGRSFMAKRRRAIDISPDTELTVTGRDEAALARYEGSVSRPAIEKGGGGT